MDDALRDALAAELGADVRAARRVHGGDVALAYAVDLADGRRVFAKTHADPPLHFFTTEAAGLEWLREADAVLLPEVLAVADGEETGVPAHLALEWIDEGR